MKVSVEKVLIYLYRINMATEAQARWQARNRILWRLKGMFVPLNGTNVLTQEELAKLNTAFTLIKEVCDNSIQSSIELGFNAKPRCRMCNKIVYSDGYCKSHFEEWSRENEY